MTYLLEHPNRHAAAAGYGGFWGYRSRRDAVRLIVLHTSESAFDLVGADTGAENVAGFLSRVDRPASYHAIGDGDSAVKLLPWDHTAFGARGFNSDAIHIAVAGRAHDWDLLTADKVDDRLDQVVPLVAEAAAWADVPLVKLTTDAARGTGRGLCGHDQLDPTRRTDPGPAFPWRQLRYRAARVAPTVQEDDMALTKTQAEDLEFAGDMRRVLEGMDPPSNARAVRYMVRHLRDHPPGMTASQVRRIAAAVAADLVDSVDGVVDEAGIADRVEATVRRQIIADLED